MRRSLTGSSLAALLIVVIMMQQLVLGFCECAQSYYTGPCDCKQATAALEDECCEGCPLRDKIPGNTNDDCESGVSLDPGDFQWSPLDEPVAHFSVELVAQPAPAIVLKPIPSLTTSQLSPSRGSPPGDIPLYLRDSVLRL